MGQAQPTRMSTILIAIIALAILVGVFATLWAIQNSNYASLQSRYQALQTQYTSLQSRYTSLQGNYTMLENKYSQLNESYTNLQSQYTTLQSQYTTLQEQYSALQGRKLLTEIENLDSINTSILLNTTCSNPYTCTQTQAFHYDLFVPKNYEALVSIHVISNNSYTQLFIVPSVSYFFIVNNVYFPSNQYVYDQVITLGGITLQTLRYEFYFEAYQNEVAYVTIHVNTTLMYMPTNSSVQLLGMDLSGVNTSSATLEILLLNPTNSPINITEFMLGNLVCTFPTPITIPPNPQYLSPANANGLTLIIDLPIYDGTFSAANYTAGYNSGDLLCSGSEPAVVGEVYSGYIVTTDGTIPFVVYANP